MVVGPRKVFLGALWEQKKKTRQAHDVRNTSSTVVHRVAIRLINQSSFFFLLVKRGQQGEKEEQDEGEKEEEEEEEDER